MKRKLLLAALCVVGALGFKAQAQSFTEGKYYLQNVESGLFWGAGNSWGTQASLVAHPEYVTLHPNGSTYTLESQVTNGGTAYYFNGDFMDNDSPVSLTISASGDYYTIANGTNYYGYDGTSTVLGKNLAADSENALWKILSEQDMLAQMKTATAENPVDATFLILDPNFGRNNRNVGKWTMVASNQNLSGGNNINNCAESFQATFTLSQTMTVPNGYYRLTAQGFYRQDGSDNTNLPYFYANEQKGTFPLKTGAENSMSDASVSFSAGSYTIAPIDVTVSGKSLTVGAKLENNTALWCIWDNFVLTYLGPLDLSTYQTELNAAIATAKGISAPMNADVLSALTTAVSTYEGQTYDDEEGYAAAIEAVNTAINNANASIANYAAAKAYLDKASTLDATGQANYAANETVASVQAAYDAATLVAVSAEQVTALDAAIIAAAKSQTTEGADMTLALVNPSFENGFTGWTNSGMAAQGNASFEKEGNTYAEKWQPNGTFSVEQSIKLLNGGVYRISAKTKARGVTSAKLFANGVDQAITVADVVNTTTVEFACDDNAEFTFGFEGTGTGAGSSWICVDNFTLTYVGALPDVEAVEGKMNAEIATAQTTAVSAYAAEKTVANYNAAVAAINAARASVAAYTTAAADLSAANTFKAANTFVTPAAAATFAEAVAAYQTKYDNGTLTNDEATGVGASLGFTVTGWHEGANTPAVNYLESGFGLNDFETALYLNTWSTEGNNDGSNFTVPFFEYWTGDSNSLPEKTWTGTLTGLPNGLYEVSAWVRVRAKNETAATDATGITINVNGGEAVDVTEGSQIGTSQFQLENYTAQGLVKDGTLNLNFVIAADNNISWLSFKNVSYNKVRDLTEEEAAIVPTAIALNATATIYKGNTLTLAPTFTPDDATQTVTWTSDNDAVATVANGVVTAVGYGTANITVASTLDEEVSSTCVITVTAPLITEAANLDFADGPVATTNVVTYAKDMGTGKAQMQDVTGWSITSNGDARAAAVYEYNSGLGLGSATNIVPTAGPEGTNGYVLGVEAVWDAVAQYTQAVRIPAGAYTIKAYVYNQAGTEAVEKNLIGVKEDGGAEHFGTTTNYAVGSWTTETISFIINEDTYGQLSLGYDGKNVGNGSAPHLFIDRMDISYEPFATAEDYAALNTAIEDAEAEAATKTLGFQAGEYAPYANAAAITALAAAKAIDQNANNAQSAVQAATAALESASWTANTEEVNAIYDGTFAAAVNNGAPAGWTMSNNTLGGDYHSRAFVGDERVSEFNETNSAFYIRFDGTNSNRGSMYYYGNTEGYTMPLKADTYYRVTVDFAGWGSTGKPLRMNVTGPEGFSSVGQQYTTEVRADNADNAPQQFNVVFKTSAAGNYVINFQTPGADSNTHAVVISNLQLFTEPETTVTLAVSAAKYGTFIAPFNVEVPAGVTASTISGTQEDGTTLELTPVENNVIPANTPVILFSESEVSEQVSGINIATEASYTSGLLTGVYAATAAPVGSYVLQNNGKVGFYEVVDGKQPTVGANRAYMTVSDAAAGQRAFFFPTDEATGIATIAAMTEGEVEAIYTVGGAKVESLQKGLNILKLKNGQTRKVFVK